MKTLPKTEQLDTTVPLTGSTSYLLAPAAPHFGPVCPVSLWEWEAYLLDLMDQGVWSEKESGENISVLEMRAVELALASFVP